MPLPLSFSLFFHIISYFQSQIDILVELGGAAVNACDDAAETALFYALRENKYAAAKRLIALGVDLNAQNSSQETAYEFARSLNDQAALDMFAELFAPQQAAAQSDSMDLVNSAKLFGSNGFNPQFKSQSNHLNR